MKLVAVLREQVVPIEVTRTNDEFCLTLNGKTFSVNAIRTTQQSLSLIVEGKSYEVGLEKKGNQYSVYFYNNTVYLNLYEARKYKATELAKKPVTSGPFSVVAPMPGKIIKITAVENQTVSEGEPLLIMEAMKMQNELKAPRAGVVRQLHVKEGEPVSPQQVLLILE
jgi:glutaconyl-CoA/methylmalonyl-CoA decarboxylase subunit gamma